MEEMDISDKNFKPCPCGYQVCQFCYNNIRQNPELNGRCPACRRVYDDESVEYRIVSQEEWKYEQSKQSRKDREKKQKEKERKEHEQANRKHLAGMRVIQKNLVYVVGLNPAAPSDELHAILRSDKYFGQYGKILKIVINKRNPPPGSSTLQHHPIGNAGFGVYVTFSKKEEAQKCINAIDGTYIDGRPLKAAFGTTKYCSSYLRGQPCPNPNCMFLHEPGEEADSYTRQDLSTRQGLKMGGEGFQKNGTAFPKHSNGSQFFNVHEEPVQAPQEAHSPSVHQPILNAAPLPSTASWASSSKTAVTTSTTTTNAAFANASAFPTLAESTTLQQQQQQQHQQRKQKQQQNQFSDEFNPEVSPGAFVDETINFLNSLSSISYKIRTDNVDRDYITNHPPLFAFNSIKVNKFSSSSLTLKFVQSLLPKPQRNATSPFQAPQSQTPIQQQAQPHELQQQGQGQGQQFFNQQQQQQQQQQQPTAIAQALLQQQLLLQQQQQQQQGQDHQHQPTNVNQLLQEHLLQQQQQSNQTSLLNTLKNERSFAATPPPGLFNAHEQQTPASHSNQASGTASELLSHLMNGKKISA